MGVMQLSSVSKVMAAAVANTLNSRPRLLVIGWGLERPLDTRLLLSWAGRFSYLHIERDGMHAPGLERFLAAACSLSKLRLRDTAWTAGWPKMSIDQGLLTQLLDGLRCLEELTFTLTKQSEMDGEVWLPSQQLASKLGKISVEYWFSDRALRKGIPDRCMQFLTAHLQAGGQLEMCLGVHTSDLSVHCQVAAQLAGLPCPDRVWLQLECSECPLRLQQYWQAQAALQGCHLVLSPRT